MTTVIFFLNKTDGTIFSLKLLVMYRFNLFIWYVCTKAYYMFAVKRPL